MQKLIEKLLLLIRGMWRFRWYGILVAWLVCIAGWYGLSKVDNVYEASATVYVDTDSMLRPLLRGLAVDINVGEKLGLMSRQLLSRPNLEKVIRMTDLDHGATTPAAQERILQDLTRNVNLQQTHAARPLAPRSPDLYVISSRHKDPEMARRIVEALLSTFVDETAGERRQRSDVAQQFLVQQIAEYESRLVEAEDRLREFKREHIDVLPDQEANYYGRLQAARSNLEAVELALREANFRRDELRRQLEGTPSTQRGLSADGALVQTPTEERLLTLQRRLDELLLRFTENHPDVVQTRRSIEALEVQRDRELSGIDPASSSSAVANPLHQQLRLALGEVEGEIAALRVRRDEFSTRVQRLQQQLEIIPQVEAELRRLDRNYEIYRDQYNSLVARRESARISEDVEQTGQDVRFRVIEPPRTPATPIFPGRLKFSAAILLMGLGAGAGVALLMSQLFPVVHGRRMLGDLSGRPVFGAVTRVLTPRARWMMRLDFAAFATVIALMIPAFLMAVYMQLTGRSLMAAVTSLGGLV
ncbi:lipopolysaccharide biosynthesis protein [Thioalkalivibrio sulfidiphilus HL-EbGr7]|uniref:Lipopolysaccharide biosynthesis protein n=1 Tax=Thioalkalivibrio sulfidiphilus (strain HL-EbGR7) TaxID=396588 RepID=B8GVC3_THISH|nr:XrtA system polysaccharide chain length determinant [Thioalkalivibrio sulfidiphilus]ACL73469.1 lipopolysaccharide biosynthesis protein [Thioalkalivibrio sulfidiphilus HL-EbGr7]